MPELLFKKHADAHLETYFSLKPDTAQRFNIYRESLDTMLPSVYVARIFLEAERELYEDVERSQDLRIRFRMYNRFTMAYLEEHLANDLIRLL
jgi:hypothetical protein